MKLNTWGVPALDNGAVFITLSTGHTIPVNPQIAAIVRQHEQLLKQSATIKNQQWQYYPFAASPSQQ